MHIATDSNPTRSDLHPIITSYRGDTHPTVQEGTLPLTNPPTRPPPPLPEHGTETEDNASTPAPAPSTEENASPPAPAPWTDILETIEVYAKRRRDNQLQPRRGNLLQLRKAKTAATVAIHILQFLLQDLEVPAVKKLQSQPPHDEPSPRLSLPKLL